MTLTPQRSATSIPARLAGRPAESWTELWDDLHSPPSERVGTAGKTLYAKDREFYIERHGYPETVYFDISFLRRSRTKAVKIGGHPLHRQ